MSKGSAGGDFYVHMYMASYTSLDSDIPCIYSQFAAADTIIREI